MKTTVRVEGLPELRQALESLGARTRGAVRQSATAGAEVIRLEAARRAPGPHIGKALKDSSRLSAEMMIGPDSAHWYYQFAETGAAPHEIDGHTKKAIQFMGKQGLIVRRSVKHSGMAANPFLRPAIDSAASRAVQAVAAVLREAVE